MPAGTTQFTQTLDRIMVVVAAVSGMHADRCFQGYKRFADATNFQNQVEALTAQTQGFFYAGLKRIRGKENQMRAFDIVGELCVYVPKDTTTDMNAAWDLAGAIVAALKSQTNFNNIAKPGEIVCSLHDHRIIETGGVAIFDFGKYGDGQIQYLDP